MRSVIYAGIVSLCLLACNSQKTFSNDNAGTASNDTVRIANDSLQYEVIIIDGQFNNWLATRARPRNFYSQSYLEARNRVWVNEWNNRARTPQYSNTFMPIDYQSSINYGYEVNYLLFNYLTYFQLTNNIRLGGFTPRI